MPSADFCATVRSPCDDPSPEGHGADLPRYCEAEDPQEEILPAATRYLRRTSATAPTRRGHTAAAPPSNAMNSRRLMGLSLQTKLRVSPIVHHNKFDAKMQDVRGVFASAA